MVLSVIQIKHIGSVQINDDTATAPAKESVSNTICTVYQVLNWQLTKVQGTDSAIITLPQSINGGYVWVLLSSKARIQIRVLY